MLLIRAHAYFNSFSAAATKGFSLGSKTNPRRLLKTSHRSLLTKRVRVHLPVRPSYRRFPLRRNLIPLAFHIQRLKISLPLLKRMLKRSRIYKKIIKSQINKATGYVRRSQHANDSKKTKWRSWAGKISSKKFRNVLFDRSSLLHVLTLTWIRVYYPFLFNFVIEILSFVSLLYSELKGATSIIHSFIPKKLKRSTFLCIRGIILPATVYSWTDHTRTVWDLNTGKKRQDSSLVNLLDAATFLQFTGVNLPKDKVQFRIRVWRRWESLHTSQMAHQAGVFLRFL